MEEGELVELFLFESDFGNQYLSDAKEKSVSRPQEFGVGGNNEQLGNLDNDMYATV